MTELKRLKAEESRALLLEDGRRQFREAGTILGIPRIDKVTLKEAVDKTIVPRSTAYRLYEGTPGGQLEAFLTEVLDSLEGDPYWEKRCVVSAPEIEIEGEDDF